MSMKVGFSCHHNSINQPTNHQQTALVNKHIVGDIKRAGALDAVWQSIAQRHASSIFECQYASSSN